MNLLGTRTQGGLKRVTANIMDYCARFVGDLGEWSWIFNKIQYNIIYVQYIYPIRY